MNLYLVWSNNAQSESFVFNLNRRGLCHTMHFLVDVIIEGQFKFNARSLIVFVMRTHFVYEANFTSRE